LSFLPEKTDKSGWDIEEEQKETMSEYISLCIVCGTPLKSKRVNGTVVFFCPYCEKIKEYLRTACLTIDEMEMRFVKNQFETTLGV